MTDVEFIWNEMPSGNVDHITDNDLTPDDIVHALATVTEFTFSRSSGRPAFKGFTADGRHIFVVYNEVYENVIYVVTAYEID
ncbi:MAG: hypothetical protein ETSY1_31885 [Candidatus Entotheonella factor]|uniref:DUF4258 domain-containing protein n=1 Tax=Entotheonella factor TaxID=1429438 RepID=W4LAW1_ENTF1|nr:MAG: hypothetical protein ETSY1_31885 [Candidatus Entotheonella factor]